MRELAGSEETSSAEQAPTILALKNAVREQIVDQSERDESLFRLPDQLRKRIWNILDEKKESLFPSFVMTLVDRQQLTEEILRQLTGYGVIDSLIKDPEITEIMVNGISQIFIEKSGRLLPVVTEQGLPLSFPSETDLLHVIEKIVAPINRKVDESDPIVDARLSDGSRVNAVIRPVSLGGPVLTIRKFPDVPYTMEQLVNFGALQEPIAELLARLVQARFNIVVCGGTGSGKTTFLNALSMFIPADERIITVEDAAELKLSHIPNLVQLETRPPNTEGKGEITMRDLVRSALRMRPDRIIVGEVRGGEALDMLQAMNTGHEGSLTTGHANSAEDMLSRLETMVLMSGLELPVSAIRKQIAAGVELVVHLGRLRDGSRRVMQIGEVRGMREGEITFAEIARWKTTGVTDEGMLMGHLAATGEVIRRTDKWLAAGLPSHPMLAANGK